MRRSEEMGGGSVMRAVGRAVGSGIDVVKEAVSATACARAVRPAQVVVFPSSSSTGASGSSSTQVDAAEAAAGCRGSMLCFCDGDEWEAVEGEEEVEMGEGIGTSERFERFVFGPVPSTEEAEEAVSTIHQMFVPIAFSEAIEGPLSAEEDVKDKGIISMHKLKRSLSTESQSDWIEPAIHLYSSKSYQSQEREKVLDAFRLLQINPSIQKIVVSLSSDRAVWDAVMKNEVVQEFKKLFYEESKQQYSNDGAVAARGILKWIIKAKAKLMEVFGKILKHMNQVFRPHGPEAEYHVFSEFLRSSFMISVVVFIIVVMNRARRY